MALEAASLPKEVVIPPWPPTALHGTVSKAGNLRQILSVLILNGCHPSSKAGSLSDRADFKMSFELKIPGVE